MCHLSRMLVTILLNVLLLTANGGWLLAQFQMTIVWVRAPRGEFSVRIDREGWLGQRTLSHFHSAVYGSQAGVRSFSFDNDDAPRSNWEAALHDEVAFRSLPGMVFVDRWNTRNPMFRLILGGIRHWLVLSLVWIVWLGWNRDVLKRSFHRAE